MKAAIFSTDAKILHRCTETRAGLVRSALLKEVLLYMSLLFWRLAVELMAATAAPYVQLLDRRLADARKATFSWPIGDWNYAAEIEDVVSGVVPER